MAFERVADASCSEKAAKEKLRCSADRLDVRSASGVQQLLHTPHALALKLASHHPRGHHPIAYRVSTDLAIRLVC